MKLIYREALPSDAKDCIELRGKTRENSFSIEQLEELGITEETWTTHIANGNIHGYVCTFGQSIAGYCYGDTSSGEVVVLAVAQSYENLGIGKCLLETLLVNFENRGFKKLYLGCSNNPNSRSYGFYRHLGWVSSGQYESGGDEILEYIF